VLADDAEGAMSDALFGWTRAPTDRPHRRTLDTTSGRERLSGYVRALREASIPLDDTLIHAGITSRRPAPLPLAKLLDPLIRPARSSFQPMKATLGVLRVTAERGLSIPDDLSLLLLRAFALVEWHRPAISSSTTARATSISPSIDCCTYGRQGNASTACREYRVGARLVKRDSCRPFDPSATKSSISKSSACKA